MLCMEILCGKACGVLALANKLSVSYLPMQQLGATYKSQVCFRDCCGLIAGLISTLFKPILFQLRREAPSQLIPCPAHCIYLSVVFFHIRHLKKSVLSF